MYNFLINDFEGPLDLLLHLIKNSKMDIYDISISKITQQYIDFINKMKKLDLDIASEYLVMAAELMEIKSRSLLPKKESEEQQLDEVNPEEELKRRLIEYKKIKESTEYLRKLESNRDNFYTKLPEAIDNISDEHYINDGNVSINDLVDALKSVLERKEYSKPINTKITTKELSVKERIDKIRNVLKTHKKVSFVSLFKEDHTKPYIVVTFLSILEMAKNKELIIKQESNFKDIYIESIRKSGEK